MVAELFILSGLQFSGKTYTAELIRERNNAIIISFDAIYRANLKSFEERGMSETARWLEVKTMAVKKLRDNLQQGKKVIWDSTNPRREHRDELRRIAEEEGAKSKLVFVKTPLQIIFERKENNSILQNRHDIDLSDIEETIKEMEEPQEDERPFIFEHGDNPRIFIKMLLEKD